MKKCTRCAETKDLSNFHVQSASSDGYKAACKKCINKSTLEYRKLNHAKVLAATAAWRDARPDHGAIYYSRNREKSKANALRWAKENKRACCQKTAKRKALKLRAMPVWADRSLINAIYKLAAQKSNETGVRWEVDHIVPLNSSLVCGLHVHHNLQVVPVSFNRSKSNQLWPDMPGTDRDTKQMIF
jgi:hypothetical protein